MKPTMAVKRVATDFTDETDQQGACVALIRSFDVKSVADLFDSLKFVGR